MMRNLTGLLLFPLFLVSCEKDIELEIDPGEDNIVVYGVIEAGQAPYVMLTRSLPVFSTLTLSSVAGSFVHGAVINISEGSESVTLEEYCINDLDDTLKSFFAELMGVDNADSLAVNICIYSLDTADFAVMKMFGVAGRTYSLIAAAGGKVLTAVTTIPFPTGLDSLWTIPHSKPEFSNLVQMWARYDDPPKLGNYVRYFTKVNSEPFYSSYFRSVFSDELINGKAFDFPLERGINRNSEVSFDDVDTYGYFAKGDTVIVKWSSIDKAHYDFWITLESDRTSGDNPFGSPVRIKSNINGGLGIWGGYSPAYDTLIIAK